jgi:hypothetical protein
MGIWDAGWNHYLSTLFVIDWLIYCA